MILNVTIKKVKNENDDKQPFLFKGYLSKSLQYGANQVFCGIGKTLEETKEKCVIYINQFHNPNNRDDITLSEIIFFDDIQNTEN